METKKLQLIKEVKFSPKILQQDPKFMDRGPIFSTALGLGLKEV